MSFTPYLPTWDSLDSRPMPQWYNQAKFGIFIHWGVYSVPAWRPLSKERYASYAEWYYATVIGDDEFGGDEFHRSTYGEQFEYRDFAPMFKAELFDPDYWASLFERSGARYVVLTTKHHDGYCLWPTDSPYKKAWNSMAVGPRRDLVGDLTTAVRNRGLRMGLYYSIIEWESVWTHRSETGYYVSDDMVNKYRIPEDRYVDEHLIPQLKELVSRYKPALIFSDGGEWDGSEEYFKTKDFLAWLYNEAPNRDEVVVNDRWAKDMPGRHGDYYSSEYEDTDAIGREHPWEESRGIGGSYGLNRAENIEDYRTSEELIHELVDVVSRGGNMLLNVGPAADGTIPVIQQQRLIDIGDWLTVNGEAIYDAQNWKSGGPPSMNSDLRFTTNGADVYAICREWPTGPLILREIPYSESIKVEMLGTERPTSYQSFEGKLSIEAPTLTPGEAPCQHAFVFKISGTTP
ncbi:MAG: alpha-L-fucosidase [Candidatus Latescibacteria bacterium]|jgi:alpha-L-fucosidase|nr:alpha-L-fucosidase [Candidatus Latescibacterota bacterium]